MQIVSGLFPFIELPLNYSIYCIKILTYIRGETTHYPPIPEDTLDELFKLGANVYELMDARYSLDQQKFDEALKTIPKMYQDNYHVLFSLLMEFIVTYFDGRRGAEGIELLTKNHWKLVDKNGRRYLKKVIYS